MAIYHLSATPVQRSKGQTATAGAAYRAGEKIRDERTGLTHDYQRKRGIVQSAIIVPDNAPDWTRDRAELWNRAEAAERQYNGQPAREIRLGLPHELTDQQRADLVFNYARDMFVSSGMVADISIHRPDRHGDQRNDHAHILLTMRELDGDQFSTRKNREWNKTGKLEYWREQWAEYQNDALEEAGSEARVDHRSYEAQGIPREATRHLGKDASAMEREGTASRIGDENRAVREHNQYIDQLISELEAVEAEISRELEKELSAPEPEITFSFPTAPEQPAPEIKTADPEIAEPVKTWEEQKREGQRAFESDVTAEFKRDIEAGGEVKEYGLGKNWFDRSVTMFENLYYGTIEVVGTIRDKWQEYIGKRDRSVRRDRDDPDKGEMDR